MEYLKRRNEFYWAKAITNKKFVKGFVREILYYNLRHLVKPGITGWVHMHHEYAAGLGETIEKLEYDLYYIKNMTVWRDLIIVLKTISTLL
jgi:lipopolysaccharide/colanic/teichoic acid biosynthesis glycosyltransferase